MLDAILLSYLTYKVISPINTQYIPYCYLFLRELNFNFFALAKKYVQNIKNTIKNIQNEFLWDLNFAIFLKETLALEAS